MKQYALLFRMNITDKKAQPTKSEMKTYMNDWSQWITDLVKRGQLGEGGNHFSKKGKVLAPRGQIVQQPYKGADRTSVAGYIIVMAKNLTEATKIARNCPILNGENTSVEIRELANR